MPASVRDPIRVPKTAELVADQIRRRIIRGELREGDFLPLGNQVMEQLGISRPTLREALRILEAENLISVMRGSRSGAKVHMPSVEGASRYAGFVLQVQGTTVADIYEARLAIEPYVARRLAQSRPEGAADRLKAEIERLSALVNEGRYVDFNITVAKFHCLMVELSGMRAVLFLTRMLQEVVSRYQVLYAEHDDIPLEAQHKRALLGIRSFRKFIGLIEAGDADGAESFWRLHLVNANKSWVPPGHHTRVVDLFE